MGIDGEFTTVLREYSGRVDGEFTTVLGEYSGRRRRVHQESFVGMDSMFTTVFRESIVG